MKVVSFYRFLDISDLQEFRSELQTLCVEQNLLGTILVANEGFNGRIAGSDQSVRQVFSWLT